MHNKKPYSYRLRPGYGSGMLLFEFVRKGNPETLVSELTSLLESNGFCFRHLSDSFIFDEFFYTFRSGNGEVVLSRDNWDLVFIMTQAPEDVPLIDRVLLESGWFEKETADASRYN